MRGDVVDLDIHRLTRALQETLEPEDMALVRPYLPMPVTAADRRSLRELAQAITGYYAGLNPDPELRAPIG